MAIKNKAKMVGPKLSKTQSSWVKILGYRYLWVDRYRIDQTNPQDKHTQIEIMDQINTPGLLRLMLGQRATTQTPDFGLPGVSTSCGNERWPTALHLITYLTLPVQVNMGKMRVDLLGSSTISAMPFFFCLLLTVAQVYYVCKTTYHCECIARSS